MTTILQPPIRPLTIQGIGDGLKDAFKKKALREGKSLEDKIRELMEDYVKNK